MPGRNIRKLYLEDSYYHVYGRGHSRTTIFLDNQDYAVFLNLYKRYLSNDPVKDNAGREYPHLQNKIELLAFCLMPNHFHALVYQNSSEAITQLFKSVLTTYGMYFNKKYHKNGPILQSSYRATSIDNEAYLTHISRYIHLNPKLYRDWEFSSLPYYLGAKSAEWVHPNRILELFNSKKEYIDFIEDYEDYKQMLDEIKYELANN